MRYARIHNIDIEDTKKLTFSDVRKISKRADGSKDVVDVVRANTISFLESDDAVYKQVMELLSNESFSPIHIQDDYSVNLLGDPVNMRNTIRGKDGNVRGFSVTVQNKYRGMELDWEAREILTYWDTIVTDDFTESGLIQWTEGNNGTTSDMVWKAVIGNWQVQSANDNLDCYSDSGYNVCVAIGKTASNLLPATANVVVQADIDMVGLNHEAGLIIRSDGQLGAGVYGNSYGFSIYDGSPDKATFYRFEDSTFTTLKVWENDGAYPYTSVYKLMVVARGNRFDCYVNEQFIGTVYDDVYKAGWHGVSAASTTPNADNFSLVHAKPEVVRLPVGAYDYDQIRMPATSRLNDDTVADGVSRTIVAPNNSIEFKQDFVNDPSGGEVKVFDTMGEDGLWDHLEFLARMNENNTKLFDSSKNNRTITTYGTPTVASSSYNEYAKTAIELEGDGSGDYYTVATSGATFYETTMGGWINTDDATDSNQWFFNGSAAERFRFGIASSQKLFCVMYDTSNDVLTTTTDNAVINTGQDHFVVVVMKKESGYPKIYVDGELVASSTSGVGDPINWRGIGEGFVIGRYVADQEFDGKMDDWFQFSTVASADRIRWWYENMPSMVDESQWKQVFDINRKFIGDLVVSSGAVRLSGSRLSGVDKLRTEVFTDGQWESIEYSFAWSSLGIVSVKREVTTLKRYEVVIKETSFYRQTPAVEMVWTDYTLTAGSPMINIENVRVL